MRIYCQWRTIVLLTSLLTVAGCGNPADQIGVDVDVHRAPGSIWSVAAADLTGDGEPEHILGSLEDQLIVQSPEGVTLWTADLGGMPFAIQCGDLDGDGINEVVVSAFDAEGTLHVFDCKGTLLWTWSMGKALFGLEIVDLDGDGRDEVLTGGLNTPLYCLDQSGSVVWSKDLTDFGVRVVRAGDIDNDGELEFIIAQPKRSIIAFEQNGAQLWEWEVNPEHGLFSWTSEIFIEDLDEDGVNEIITATRPEGRTTVFNGQGEILWQQNNLIRSPVMPGCATVMAEIGDFAPAPGKEVLILTWCEMLYLFDAQGNRLLSERTPFPLMCITSPDRKSNKLLTGTGIRETQYYTWTIGVEEDDQLAIMQTEHPAKSNLETIRTQLEKLAAVPIAETRNTQPYVVAYKSQEPSRAYEYNVPRIYQFLKDRHDSENFQFEMEYLAWEAGFDNINLKWLLPTRMSSEELIAVAAFSEENNIPFWYQICHGMKPHMSVKTAEGVLKAAPTMCKGFMFSESLGQGPQMQEFLKYADAVMQLCVKYGRRKAIFHQHNRFFDAAMADSRFFDVLCKEEYRDIFIPMLKPNNMPFTDVQIAGAVGLWRSGVVKDWAYSNQIGNWRWTAIEREHLCPWDVMMRFELSAAALGAKYFRIERPEVYLDVKRDKNDRMTSIAVHEEQAMERDLFYTLLKKGLVQQGSVDEMTSLSPVVFQESNSLDDNRLSGGDGLLVGRLGPQTVSPEYAPGYLTTSPGETNRYFCGMTKANPHGVTTIIPGGTAAANIVGAERIWKTDGINVELDGSMVPPIQAREEILKSFKSGAESLPFRAESIWLSAVQLDDDRYVLYCLDSGYFEARGSEDWIRTTLPWSEFTVTDRITGENLPVDGKRFRMEIPDAAFRILDVRRNK
jgi:hypothetical protein